MQRFARELLDGYTDDPEGLAGIDAMLVILRERLHLLDRAIRGMLDPRLAWCVENDATIFPGDPAEEDVRLVAWSDRKLARHHRAEWKRARKRLQAR